MDVNRATREARNCIVFSDAKACGKVRSEIEDEMRFSGKMRLIQQAKLGCGKEVEVSYLGDQNTVEIVVQVISSGCGKNSSSGVGSLPMYRANTFPSGDL